jgi:hypothetical protein
VDDFLEEVQLSKQRKTWRGYRVSLGYFQELDGDGRTIHNPGVVHGNVHDGWINGLDHNVPRLVACGDRN